MAMLGVDFQVVQQWHGNSNKYIQAAQALDLSIGV
jgi:hypothetical protein